MSCANKKCKTLTQDFMYYLIGFVASVILTFISFFIVINSIFIKSMLITALVISGVVQIIVHFFCFLHFNRYSDHQWEIISLVFAILIIGIIIGGSLWIMKHLSYLSMFH